MSDRLRIENGWLCREVDECTCGTGPGGYYGAHEPGCGLTPEVDLRTIPGFDALAAAEAERDALAATVQRVEALADEWEAAGLWIPGERLRDALGGRS